VGKHAYATGGWIHKKEGEENGEGKVATCLKIGRNR